MFDISAVKVQEKQKHYKDYINKIALCGALGECRTYTENESVKAIIGMQEQWHGRAIVWALIGDVSKWILFHREVKSIMEDYASNHGIIRIELTTEVGFNESERWAKMLGFYQESIMRNYGPDGRDHKMWVKICQQHYRL